MWNAAPMLNADQNELVTGTGPGTPCGGVMRRVWQPAALTEELAGERPLKALRLMGEDLVLFRDGGGRYGLIGRRCPHRGADLGFGRLEDGGLRCPFHGWLFDAAGRCLEQPAEPPESDFHTKIAHRAYPCRERNGIVFAWLGPGAPPPFPGFDCFAAPAEYCFAFKGFLDCNWLQALEVGIDPAHASFLHRFLDDDESEEGYGRQFRDRTSLAAMPLTRLLREYPRPKIEVAPADHGLRILASRTLDEAFTHVRVTNLVFPNAIAIPMSGDMTITQWHVPIDDRRSWWYAIFSAFEHRVDKALMRRQRLELYTLPDYMPRRNRANDYGFDPSEQRDRTYTGMGADINVHDQWAVESLGAIADRTAENLATTDKAIAACRRMLLRAVESAGADAPMPPDGGTASRLWGPVAIDAIGGAGDGPGFWAARDRERRDRSPWATPIGPAPGEAA